MYINWAHHYIPKISGSCAYLLNCLFIFIISDDKKIQLGNYRFLLLTFALYNLTCTTIDFIIPSSVLDNGHAWSHFISGGYFEKKSTIGSLLLSFRTSLISASYGILHSHFVYRYLALFNQNILDKFIPYGLLLSVLHFSSMMALWTWVTFTLLVPDNERIVYMQPIYREVLDQDVNELNTIIALYSNGSAETLRKSWAGILGVSTISVVSLLIYLVLGVLTMKKLKSVHLGMSQKTKDLQHLLMKALIVQSTIPMFVSFFPCLLAWYLPVFGIDIGLWINWAAAIAITFFPLLDPLSLFYFLPIFRSRVREILHLKTQSTTVVPSMATVAF